MAGVVVGGTAASSWRKSEPTATLIERAVVPRSADVGGVLKPVPVRGISGEPSIDSPVAAADSSASALPVVAALEEVEVLRQQVAALESKLKAEQVTRELEAGKPIPKPKVVPDRHQPDSLRRAFLASLKEAGFSGDVTAIDCSEFPCIVFGYGFGDRGDAEKLKATASFAGYRDDSIHSFGWSLSARDPTQRFAGMAVMSKEDEEQAKRDGYSLSQRLRVRMEALAAANRSPDPKP